ncbi:MAG: helix-turn-helix domain-containing protein [Tepidisphaeraceae bacterium]
MPLPLQTRLVVQNPTESPLGRITLAGALCKDDRGLRMSMRLLGSYAVVYLVEGGGRYRDARGLDRRVGAGDLLLLFPEIAHLYGPESGDRWGEFYIVFDGPVFDLWRRQGLLDASQPVRHLEPIEYWLRRWEHAVEGSEDASAPSAEVTMTSVCRVQQALADALAYERQSVVAEQDRAWVARAMAMLDSTDLATARERDLELVASGLKMSYASFRKRFARLVGMPPAKYRMKRVMDHACEMIFQQRLTNKEVAVACGFCDEFHFSRRFKQVVGLSPREFRRHVPGTARAPR